MRISTRLFGTVMSVALTALLAGCAATVPMTPAPDAKLASCAEVTVRLPDELAGGTDAMGNPNSVPLERRETNAQATGAWGSPATVLLWCGDVPPGPSTLPCVSVNDVDWIVDESDAPRYRFTTFGRTPTVSVVVDSSRASGSTILADLAPAVLATERTGGCAS
ncbi:MAG TPA: DUF3515 family protein [Microbacteriaceae bacterium]|nr:DUF3515 family protein [Microbacteriaceae bacterium]